MGGGIMVKPLSSPLIRELEAARTDIWRQQCEVVQRFGQNRLEVGFTTEEGNEALIAAGLPTLDSEQMGRAFRGQPSDPEGPGPARPPTLEGEEHARLTRY